MSVSLHRLTRTSRSSFPAAFAVLSQNKEWQATIQYTLQRCATFPTRDSYPCYQPGVPSRPHFLGVRPSIRSKPITALLRDPAHPPFCIARPSVAYQSWALDPRPLIQSIIDPSAQVVHLLGPESLRPLNQLCDRNHHSSATRHPSVCERKKIQLTSPPHSRSHG